MPNRGQIILGRQYQQKRNGVRWPTAEAQTARRRRPDLTAESSRAFKIADWMLSPTARATGGGKALPIWRYCAVLRPENRQEAGKPWTAAAIGSVRRGR